MPRRFIRHPAAVPIQLCNRGTDRGQHSQHRLTHDLSAGGLSCESDQLLQPGEAVEVEIFVQPPPSFKTVGRVVWCHRQGDVYLVGIGFSDMATAYSVRMVEQICYIEQYRQRVLQEEGRELSSEEAALEWIARHAEDFPQSMH